MKILAVSVAMALAVAACTSAPPEPTPPLPLSSTAPSDATATLDQLLPQIEASDQMAREAAAAFTRECSAPDAHLLRCSRAEPAPYGSLRSTVDVHSEFCKRMREDYNRIARLINHEVIIWSTPNRVDPGHPITCDGTG